jgi:hypothetical protein
MAEPAFRTDPHVGGATSPDHQNSGSSPNLPGYSQDPGTFFTTWKSGMCGENERPISLGDKSITFIRLTLANADDHFKAESTCHFDVS